MTVELRRSRDIYEDLEFDLTDNIDQLTNFADGSFDDAMVQAYAEQLREVELKAVAATLSGFIEFAGKDLTQRDLESLGLDNVEPVEINQYMRDEHLDRLVANVGVERDQGTPASGTVTFEVSNDAVEISEGTIIGTRPDTDGNFLRFAVDADEDGEIDPDSGASVSPDDGETEVEATVIAQSVGIEYNVGANTVTFIPNPTPGIQSVTNESAIDGGIPQETNEELRERSQLAIFESSVGGTKIGIESRIESEFNDVRSVSVQEFTDESPPYSDVVVDGGEDDAIREMIQEIKPVGIRHNLVRPTNILIGSQIQLVGDNIDTDTVAATVSGQIESLGIGDSLFASSILESIVTSDSAIDSVPAMTPYITIVENERITFDESQDVYVLTNGPIGIVYEEQHRVRDDSSPSFETTIPGIVEDSVDISLIIDGKRETLSADQYTVEDTDDDGELDTVVIDDSVDVSVGTNARIGYEHTTGSFEKVTVIDDGESVTLERDEEYEVIDVDDDGLYDAVSFEGYNPPLSDGDNFELFYNPYRSFEGDRSADSNERFNPDSDLIDIRVE